MKEQKEIENSSYEYKETKLTKWVFRLCFLIITICACCFAIHLEFKAMKKNENVRADAMKMTGHLSKTFENLSDAWNTIYYFYKAGELFRIVRCPDTSFKKGVVQHNTLLTFYREKIEQKNNDDEDDDENLNRVRCGERIIVNIGLKDELYKHPEDYKSYIFNVGQEPMEIIENYPFVKDALNRMHIGERATFVAIPTENNTLRPKKHTMYEITIQNKEEERKILPLYSVVKQVDNKTSVDDHITCGSVVGYIYEIYSPSGKMIKQEKEIKKVRVGSKALNDGIEQILSQMNVGERYRIFITKEEGQGLPKEIFQNNDVVIFDVRVVNIQK